MLNENKCPKHTTGGGPCYCNGGCMNNDLTQPHIHEHVPTKTEGTTTASVIIEDIMEKQNVTVKRKGKNKDWIFSWNDEHQALIYQKKDNIYRLFFENPALTYKPIWIGLLVNRGTAWITYEKELKAESIELCGSTILFT